MRKDESQTSPHTTPDITGLELQALLRPAEYFSIPEEVLENQRLAVAEKRAILASWASDLYAVDSVPALRQLPGTHAIVAVRDILAALQRLDGADTQKSDKRRWPSLKFGGNRHEINGTVSFESGDTRLQKISSEPLELRN